MLCNLLYQPMNTLFLSNSARCLNTQSFLFFPEVTMKTFYLLSEVLNPYMEGKKSFKLKCFCRYILTQISWSTNQWYNNTYLFGSYCLLLKSSIIQKFTSFSKSKFKIWNASVSESVIKTTFLGKNTSTKL